MRISLRTEKKNPKYFLTSFCQTLRFHKIQPEYKNLKFTNLLSISTYVVFLFFYLVLFFKCFVILVCIFCTLNTVKILRIKNTFSIKLCVCMYVCVYIYIYIYIYIYTHTHTLYIYIISNQKQYRVTLG